MLTTAITVYVTLSVVSAISVMASIAKQFAQVQAGKAAKYIMGGAFVVGGSLVVGALWPVMAVVAAWELSRMRRVKAKAQKLVDQVSAQQKSDAYKAGQTLRKAMFGG